MERQEPNSNGTGTMRGGCTPSDRGQPCYDREIDPNCSKGTVQKQEANAIVHCKVKESCGKAKDYADKYH